MKRIMAVTAVTAFLTVYGQSVCFALAQLLLTGAGVASYAQAGDVPVGGIIFIKSGSCPAGYSEDADIGGGRTVVGTTNGAGNVGTTGGSDTITPAGTNSGTTIANHASHTHTYTEVPNHVHLLERFPTATGGSVGFTVDTSMSGTPTNTNQNSANPTGGVATGTTAGPSATLTHSVSAEPTFTGTQFDNRSAFIRLIACVKS